MTDQTIEAEIQAKGLTAPRVTPAQIDALVKRVLFTYAVIGTSTFCHAFLDGTFFLVSGHSACVSPENFDAELGRRIAFENLQKPMRDKLWELEGYALRSRQALLQLTEKWQRDAAQRFKSANLEPDPMGRLLIEHGAVCLYNCITEVRHLMGLSWPDDTPHDLPLEVLTEHSKSP